MKETKKSMGQRFVLLLLIGLVFRGTAVSPTLAQEEPIVHAVIFWMDGCPHCHDVLDNVLPPLQQQFGDQLDILLVEIQTIEDTEKLFQLGESLGLPKSQIGVPFLLIGDAVLVGADQIRAQLPDLIKTYQAAGGTPIPAHPDLTPLLPKGTETSAPPQLISSSNTPPMTNHDGFTLAVVILIGMMTALGYTVLRLWRLKKGRITSPKPAWVQASLPLLAVVGLVVAAYLAYVETQTVVAVCGPIGDCNAVQTSEYAYLFGIPIGMIGVIGYMAILATWIWGQWQADQRAIFALLGMNVFGVLFSIYLTYLEPFVIGAVCAWCLTSSVVMTLLMLISVETTVPHLAKVQHGN